MSSTNLSQDEIIQVRKRVLSSLRFPEMKNRENTINDPARETVDWIFKTTPEDKYGPECQFLNWLESEESLFWISGKPGSGKSTLMKYLARSPRTLEILGKWKQPIKTYSFFFVEAGLTALQRRLDGCLRSLLYQMLMSEPSALDNFISSHSLDQKKSEHDWSMTELQNFFICILEAQTPAACLFIDGLDEIDTQSDERAQVIAFLTSLTRFPNIKICVSSRPESYFRHNLASYPSLVVQELNRKAITAYVKEKLDPHQHKFDAEKYDLFVDHLVFRSEGVFLWVALALRSLTRGLINGDDIRTLYKRLNELPPDLYGLYQQAWTRHNADLAHYKQTTAEIFWYTLKQPWGFHDKTSSSLSFLLATHKDLRDKVLKLVAEKKFSQQEEKKVIEEYRTWLTARTAGLLECDSYSVSFIHRSVREFLTGTNEGQQILSSDTRPTRSKYLSIINAWMLRNRVNGRELGIDDFGRFLEVLVMFAIAGYVSEDEEIKLIKEFQALIKGLQPPDCVPPVTDFDYCVEAALCGSAEFFTREKDIVAGLSPQERSEVFIQTCYAVAMMHDMQQHVVFEIYLSLMQNETGLSRDEVPVYSYWKKKLERFLSITKLLLDAGIDFEYRWGGGRSYGHPDDSMTARTSFLVAAFKLCIGSYYIAMNERYADFNTIPEPSSILIVKEEILQINECIQILQDNSSNLNEEANLYLKAAGGLCGFCRSGIACNERSACFAVQTHIFVKTFNHLKARVTKLESPDGEPSPTSGEKPSGHDPSPFVRCLSLRDVEVTVHNDTGTWTNNQNAQWQKPNPKEPEKMRKLESAFEDSLRMPLFDRRVSLYTGKNLLNVFSEVFESLIDESESVEESGERPDQKSEGKLNALLSPAGESLQSPTASPTPSADQRSLSSSWSEIEA